VKLDLPRWVVSSYLSGACPQTRVVHCLLIETSCIGARRDEYDVRNSGGHDSSLFSKEQVLTVDRPSPKTKTGQEDFVLG
jgi:hypothetical protein